jgi:MFS family permease
MAEFAPEAVSPSDEELAAAALARRQRWIIAGIIALAVLILAGIVVAVIALVTHPDAASNWRDIFIIFMAVESLIIGAALVILILQIANLINLLQNEVRPILESTSEAVNTLRGTTEFLSESLVEPVIKLNSSMAGLRRFFEMFGLGKK